MPSSIQALFATGGMTLVVIVSLSVLSLLILIERLLATRGLFLKTRLLADGVIKHLYRGESEAARQLCQKSGCLSSPLFEKPMARFALKKGLVRSTLEMERAELNQSLRARIWMLGTIAASAPFIGLFGTVLGIMASFRDIADAGGGGFAVVSRGLSEALITTAFGIIVAVEALVFYNFLQTRCAHMAFRIKIISEEFLEVLQETHAATAPSAIQTQGAHHANPAA